MTGRPGCGIMKVDRGDSPTDTGYGMPDKIPITRTMEVQMSKEEATQEEVKKEAKKAAVLPSGTMVLCDDGVERPVVTREEAMEEGTNRYFTGVVCRNGHMAERKVKGYLCTTCARIRQKARMKKRLAEDPEYKAKLAKKRAEKHKERYATDPAYKARILERAKERRKRRAEEKAAAAPAEATA